MSPQLRGEALRAKHRAIENRMVRAALAGRPMPVPAPQPETQRKQMPPSEDEMFGVDSPVNRQINDLEELCMALARRVAKLERRA